MNIPGEKMINHETLRGFGTALRTLTAIPWPWRGSEGFSSSLPWFPAIGFILGMALYVLVLLWRALPVQPWPMGCALMVVAAEIGLTRGLHLDGLADWADSIGGFNQRERRLEIMKDFRLGAFGAVGLAVALMAKWVALVRILSTGSAVWIVLILIVSRAMMVELATTLPYARSGEGMARAFVKGASSGHRAVSHALCVVACLFFGPHGLACYAAAWTMTGLFKARCRRVFGGITGDLLGTANEMVEIGLLWLCALGGQMLLPFNRWAWF
jgi:adenosylcobinamide-GDP ribazoletransferase